MVGVKAFLFARPERPEGWEQRLSDVLRDATTRHFDAREWNCARFAHACAEAVSGRRIDYRWRGNLVSSVNAALRGTSPKLAQRGDIVMASEPDPALGVCVGGEALFVTTDGLQRVPMARVSLAWMV